VFDVHNLARAFARPPSQTFAPFLAVL
jgi:hypothetical protein